MTRTCNCFALVYGRTYRRRAGRYLLALVGTAKSASSVFAIKEVDGWGFAVARDIDASIAALSADRDVIAVTVTPIIGYSAVVIVTVVWREPASS